MTLVIYDNIGQIFSQTTGNYLVPKGGIQYIEIEIPAGKRIKGIDTVAIPHEVLFDDLPKSQVEILQDRVEQLETGLLMSEGVI